ncbi:thiW protein [Lysinibacillus sphaericus CBAM5]|uniref:ThiW protein n=3 Tax=Lysinibacillus TaxID=400634 RepID=B1HPN1_LYSSC|nr:conserved hypothetical protein [Lysinibacillus sphaericus C3-41]EWH34408.1 thiW protein [Lysinibacillus sphaericus CBAM5]
MKEAAFFIFLVAKMKRSTPNMSIRKLTIMALLVAFAVAGSTFISIPTGIARAYPVQHAINVIGAIILGPVSTVVVAFVTAIIRILTGTGSLLAIPGSIIGALCAGLAYKYSGKIWFTGLGEVIGTGLLASLVAVPYAKVLMGTSVAALFFMPAFLISSTIGAILGILVASSLRKTVLVRYFNPTLFIK